VASPPEVQLPVERASRQVQVLCDPCRHPSACRVARLGGLASKQTRSPET
jgi:hypothetical protein